MLTPREFVDVELDCLRKVFAVQKEILPMVIFVKEDERYAMPIPCSNDYEKDIASEMIRHLVHEAEPDAVIYMSEAWLLLVTKTDKLPKDLKELPRPSESKDRMEAVIAHIEFKSGEKFSAHAIISRAAGAVSLGAFEISDDQTTMGRFTDFYPPNKARMQ